MLRLRKNRWIHQRMTGRSRADQRRRRVGRRLSSELLDSRLLLTIITSVDPPANSHHAGGLTDIAATFDQDVVAATATPENFVVHGSMSQGQLTGAATAVVATGPLMTHTPSNAFAAGEVVEVTATSGISTAGGPAIARVWQFRTASTGSGQFVDGGTAFGTSAAEHVALGDVDADGDLDVVLSGRELWLNDGAGGFTDSGQNLGTDLGEAGSDFADVNGDGSLDLIAGTRVSLNDGSGVFTDTGQNLGGGTATAGDVDGDGDLDLMTGVPYAPNRLFLNNGSGQFTDTGQSLGNGSTDGNSFADVDGDGDLDALERLAGTPNKIWINDGTGVFSDSTQALGGFRATKDADFGDVDADGDLDFVAGNSYSGAAHLYINDGNGVFAETQALATANSPFIYGAKLSDVDGDGDLDFISLDRLTPHQIWLNDGSGAFVDSGSRLTATRASWGANVGDLDGDGDLDVVEINRGPVGGRLWFNQNLTPSVTLAVDNATIPEEAGNAAITATLSATHTDPVTVELATSGTATATEDYTISDTQIVIPTGATTGSVTVNTVQDTVDDEDETVIVDISAVTNGQEAGTQQVTITISDDDEPIPVPEITLAVDNANIPENGGVATFAVSLSEVTTVPVTVDLLLAGTAGPGDFNASGTQVVIAPGAATGSITITALDDAIDEPDESVTVDVANVVGGTELGVQQQVTTITDDDEPVIPDVTLSADTNEISENAGVSNLTVTLSEVTSATVTVELGISGTAEASDFNASATQVVIAAGATTATLTITAVQDEDNEPDETVIVDVTNVTGGNEDGEQQQTITILDDDIPPSFAVTSMEVHASGFRLELANAIDATEINLYDTQNAGKGPADVVVTGAASGPVSGSLVIEESAVTFIKSGDPLAADTYTVTLRSADDGFKDTSGSLLDGDGDGTAGDDYVVDFTIGLAPEDARMIQVPDFVRGPGQDVNLPADVTAGIPISISEGENVRAVDLRISYDPDLLEITNATAPGGGTVVLNSTTAGLAILVYFNSNPLPAGESTFIELEASIPADNASENYGRQQVLDIHGVIVGDGNDNEFPVIVDDAIHLTSYFSDVSGNGRTNAADASQVARFAALIDAGFIGSLITDPNMLGDISGNGRINAADASLVARAAALINVPEIPPIPGGVLIAGLTGVDLPQVVSETVVPRQQIPPSTVPGPDRSHGSPVNSGEPSVGQDIPWPAVDRFMAEQSSSEVPAMEEELHPNLEDTLNELLSEAVWPS